MTTQGNPLIEPGWAVQTSGATSQFTRVYTSTERRYVNDEWVSQDVVYILPKSLASSELEIKDVASESLAGLSAGPLIVPFKFRLDDDSVDGDATVGFYAGTTFEPGCTRIGWCFRLTPLLSAGLSQVSVPTAVGADENRSAFTVAAGFLITSWADMNIGLIYGQDRIGDRTWAHEGEGWVSFMVGWQLSK